MVWVMEFYIKRVRKHEFYIIIVQTLKENIVLFELFVTGGTTKIGHNLGKRCFENVGCPDVNNKR